MCFKVTCWVPVKSMPMTFSGLFVLKRDHNFLKTSHYGLLYYYNLYKLANSIRSLPDTYRVDNSGLVWQSVHHGFLVPEFVPFYNQNLVSLADSTKAVRNYKSGASLHQGS